MPRPIKAYIDLSALHHNLTITRKYAPESQLMAIIKADAYGHGLLLAAKALNATNGFALLELDAAITLREEGFTQPILLLEGFFSAQELALFEQHQLSAVIHHNEQIAMLESCQLHNLNIFLKINTGMNRLGLSPKEFPKALKQLSNNPSISSITLMTHFANADGKLDNISFSKQADCFNQLTSTFKMPCSLSNSAAIMRHPEINQDWVRPGIMLYGASPFADTTAEALNLKPVMTLTSKVIALHQLKKGNSVGYGGSFIAEQDMKIGIVACGYADGYPRHATTGTPILVNNQRSRIVGRVSMDMLAVDLTDLENVQINSPVTLWGKGLPVEEIAQSAGTISYELLCSLSPRVDRTTENPT